MTVAEVVTKDVLTARVPWLVRGIALALAALACWTWWWLVYFRGALAPVFSAGFVPWFFYVGWMIVATFGCIGAITGWDAPCRATFGAACVVFMAAVASALTDSLPWVNQFYTAGLSAFAAVVLAGLVANPLRRWPTPEIVDAGAVVRTD